MIFLAIHLGEDGVRKAGLNGILPTKISKRGWPTTTANWEVVEDSHNGMESESRWTPLPDLNPTQLRLILSKVIKESIVLVMTNHVYRFGQTIFCQLRVGHRLKAHCGSGPPHHG